MRLNRGTLTLLLVSLVVIAVALLLTGPASAPENGEPTPTPAVVAGPVFPDIASPEAQDAVTQFEVRDNETSTFTKMTKGAEGVWAVETNNPAPTDTEKNYDQTKIVGTMGVFASLQSADRFTTDNIAQFGLDNPKYTLTVSTADKIYTVRVAGKLNPAGTRYYGLVNDDNSTVYLFQKEITFDNLLKVAAEPPYETALASVTTPPIVPGSVFPGVIAAQVTALEIRNNASGEFTTISRTPENFWEIADATLIDPFGEADQVAITTLIQTFTTLQTKESAADTNLGEYGLDNPRYTITINSSEGRAYRLDVGNAGFGGAYYALVNDDKETVYVLDNPTALDTILAVAAIPPYVRPEATPELTPEATPEATAPAEATPEITPEATAEGA